MYFPTSGVGWRVWGSRVPGSPASIAGFNGQTPQADGSPAVCAGVSADECATAIAAGECTMAFSRPFLLRRSRLRPEANPRDRDLLLALVLGTIRMHAGESLPIALMTDRRWSSLRL